MCHTSQVVTTDPIVVQPVPLVLAPVPIAAASVDPDVVAAILNRDVGLFAANSISRWAELVVPLSVASVALGSPCLTE